MPFTKGHKLYGKGGKRKGAGRPSNKKKEILKAAEDIARAFIEEHIEPVLGVYKELAAGRKVKHYNQQNGKHLYTETEVDAATLRHWIDRIVPAAKQEIDVNHTGDLTINLVDYGRRKRNNDSV